MSFGPGMMADTSEDPLDVSAAVDGTIQILEDCGALARQAGRALAWLGAAVAVLVMCGYLIWRD